MKIEIGTKFKKHVNKNNYANCEVYDIYEVISISQKTGSTSSRLVYYALSDNYGFSKPFEVSKNTILRGIEK